MRWRIGDCVLCEWNDETLHQYYHLSRWRRWGSRRWRLVPKEPKRCRVPTKGSTDPLKGNAHDSKHRETEMCSYEVHNSKATPSIWDRWNALRHSQCSPTVWDTMCRSREPKHSHTHTHTHPRYTLEKEKRHKSSRLLFFFPSPLRQSEPHGLSRIKKIINRPSFKLLAKWRN